MKRAVSEVGSAAPSAKGSRVGRPPSQASHVGAVRRAVSASKFAPSSAETALVKAPARVLKQGSPVAASPEADRAPTKVKVAVLDTGTVYLVTTSCADCGAEFSSVLLVVVLEMSIVPAYNDVLF